MVPTAEFESAMTVIENEVTWTACLRGRKSKMVDILGLEPRTYSL